MALIVQKYGGTSLGDLKRLRSIANRIKSYYSQGEKLVVVLSAMGHSTDNLLQTAHSLDPNPAGRSMDLLLSTGEQVSIALMAIALENLGVPAVPLTGIQAGITVLGEHSQARIANIDTKHILSQLKQERVCLIAGFQGTNGKDEVYTLGRGGSDTSAVAVAVALQADQCEIFTDVDGIYTADPNKVPNAKRLEYISYEEMLEMARLGAGVLHSRSVELASKNELVLHVRSSFNHRQGSFVVSQKKAGKILEKALVRGVSLKSDEARISLIDIADRPGLAAKLFSKLSKENINVNMIVQSAGQNALNTISFTVLQNQIAKAQEIARDFSRIEASGKVAVTPQIAIVSAVGVGMYSHSGIAASMFAALADLGVNIEMISTSEIKISVVVPLTEGHSALKAVHTALGLDRKAEEE